jgi:L-threonylcarbamoyladenylate synthase
MNTEILSVKDPDALQRAWKILREGGLVAFPTDTVYGIGSDAHNQAAIESIYLVKGRSLEKAIPILIADTDDLEKVVKTVTPLARRLASRFWPGPLTLVLPKQGELPPAISATSTVGVRLPDQDFARALFRLAGPLAVTSANLSGRENPCTAEEVLRQLNGRIPLILNGGKAPGGIPSTVVDATGIDPILLREGPISMKKIKSIL